VKSLILIVHGSEIELFQYEIGFDIVTLCRILSY